MVNNLSLSNLLDDFYVNSVWVGRFHGSKPCSVFGLSDVIYLRISGSHSTSRDRFTVMYQK